MLVPAQNVLRARKVHVDDRDIRTQAYLNPIKVMTVKNLLGSCVLRLELTADVCLLRRDEGITATRRVLECLAIDKANAATNELYQVTVLELIRGLRNRGATCAEQVCEQVLRDAQLSRVHAVVDHQQQACESRLRCVITMTRSELRALRE